jgi:hypothetical protein
MTPSAATLRPGFQLASTVSSTRVVVIRAPADRTPVITCGGSPMVPAAPGSPASAAGPASAAPPAADAVAIGKRYVDASGAVELLCTTAGAGPLSCDGAEMTRKAAKPLPASD